MNDNDIISQDFLCSKEFSKQKPGIKTADLEKEVERLTGVSIQDLIKKRQDKELQVQADQDNQDSKESALLHSNTDFQADTRQNKDGNSVPWADAVRCRDVLEQCKFWAQSGQCVLNAAFMLHSCSDSCAVCLHTSPMVANTHYMCEYSSGLTFLSSELNKSIKIANLNVFIF